MNPNDAIKHGYSDWLEMLKKTGNMSLLADPYNIWLEAFTTATLLERVGVIHVLNKMFREAKTLEEQNILEKAISLVELKGIAR